MTSPQATPLLLPSDYRAALGQSAPSDSMADRLLDALVEVSDLIQRMTDRRFDEYVATRKYIPRSVADDGDLLDGQTLMLRADLKSVLSITNGDGATVSAGDCELRPLNSNVKTQLAINPDAGTWTRGSSGLSRARSRPAAWRRERPTPSTTPCDSSPNSPTATASLRSRFATSSR